MSANKEKAWERVQEKAFTSWVNQGLTGSGLTVERLDRDLATGVALGTFLESASGNKKIAFNRRPQQRIHYIESVNQLLQFVQTGLNVKLVGVGAEDIVDGNLKLILGLLWSLFRKLRVESIKVEDRSAEEGLLVWLRNMTNGYKGVQINGYKDSFGDGLALNALVHKFDPSLVNYDSLSAADREKNLVAAFDAAEKHLGIPKLLEPSDLMDGNPDERSVVLYLSLFFHAFVAQEERKKLEASKDAVSKNLTDLKSQLDASQLEAEELLRKQRAEAEANARLQAQLDFARDEARALAEKLAALAKLLEETEEERKRREAEAARLLRELEGERAAGEEAEERRRRLKKELEDLQTQVAKEVERRRKKAQHALELEKENEAFRQRTVLEGKARSGLDALKRNLQEHLEDLYKWRELFQQAQPDEPPFDLTAVLTALAGKSFDEQLTQLNDRLQGENKTLQKIISIKDAKQELEDIVDKKGWLLLKGSKKQKEWRKHWFVLKGAVLLYYKSEEAERHIGQIPLKDCQIFPQKAEKDDKGKKQFPVRINVFDRNIFLCFTTKKEKLAWLLLLNGKIQHLQYLAACEKSGQRVDTRLLHFFASQKCVDFALNHNPVSAAEAESIAKMLPLHDALENVAIEDAQLGDKELELLAVGLEKTNLKTLRLGRNKLTGAAAATLAKVLASNEQLSELHIDANKFDDAGLAALADAASKHKTLRVLNLAENQISGAGVAKFAAIQSSADNLIASLLLAKNKIGDDAAQPIADLCKAKNITVVDLSGNLLTDAGAATLARGLAANDNVEQLDLSSNKIGNDGAVALAEILAKSNKSIDKLDLSSNKIDAKASGLLQSQAFALPNLVFVRTIA